MKLHFISVQPTDKYFLDQLWIQCHNFRRMGYSDRYRVLLFIPSGRPGMDPGWADLFEAYPEVQFFAYEDEHNVMRLIQAFDYIPLLRPYCLKRHFEAFPELVNDAIFYHDSDIIFSRPLDLEPFLGDDTCYLSNTASYISSDYFDSKEKDVRPDKLEAYQRIDVLDNAARLCGITREVAERNKESTGGAQYLMKGIDAKFWEDVMDGCMTIRLHLRSINDRFFPSEDEGFQSWCADMWAVLWNLWRRGYQTLTPKELDFAWAGDPITKLDELYIYHDANGGPDSTYNKSVYANNDRSPFCEDLSWVNPHTASHFYVQEILATKNTHSLC